MSLFRAARAVADTDGEGPVDWTAVSTAAHAATDAGDLTLSEAERDGYADDVADARDGIREAAAIDFDLPHSVQIQNRHHWIDANIGTFERLLDPLEEKASLAPSLARAANTGSMAVTLGFLANNVLGQYDPLLLGEGDHELYFVHPNIEKVAESLDVDRDRFRRWIAFHEVSHAAEFGAAPWLGPHLEDKMEEAVSELADGHLDRDALRELTVTMTAVEGYAELVMDRAFDREYEDLREKLDARRQNAGPVSSIIRKLLGFDMKRKQYERGKDFFDAVADARGVAAAGVVWEDPEYLPTDEELDDPELWLSRVA
ncbi:zinc-dependent metalloprotease [Natronomonas amylolytica]|uniref:zinc-dependent metalloprotease n=1 Tax=Natronomonas amylolytica TaxID=3108498 RepID=UPI00300A105C